MSVGEWNFEFFFAKSSKEKGVGGGALKIANEMKWNAMNIYFSINKDLHIYVKYFNNLKILWRIVVVDCIFKAINLPRIKEKTY